MRGGKKGTSVSGRGGGKKKKMSTKWGGGCIVPVKKGRGKGKK